MCVLQPHGNGNFISGWARTVGATQQARLKERPGVLVITYSCSMCSADGKVDIDKLVRLKGADYSLVNRRSPCRLKPDCKGWIRFFYSHGIMVPMWDDATAERWCERDWEQRKAAIGGIYDADSVREKKRRDRR